MGTTVIYVTHDQTEALTMSDLVVVMHQARVAQVGTPRVFYEAPANLFVADFLGDLEIFLTATVAHVCGDEFAVEIGSGEKMRVARGSSAAAPGGAPVALRTTARLPGAAADDHRATRIFFRRRSPPQTRPHRHTRPSQ